MTIRSITMGTWMLILEILIGALGTLLTWVKAGDFGTISIIVLVITIVIAAAQYWLNSLVKQDFMMAGFVFKTWNRVLGKK